MFGGEYMITTPKWADTMEKHRSKQLKVASFQGHFRELWERTSEAIAWGISWLYWLMVVSLNMEMADSSEQLKLFLFK